MSDGTEAPVPTDPIDVFLSSLLKWSKRGARATVFVACVTGLYILKPLVAIAVLAFAVHLAGWRKT
tara:strand:- start:178 stop:375 length:198 start_codon:yes stop_codon:yes gene_type:complete